MNKHIIGLIVFSFIVGMSAVIASFFIPMPQMPKLDSVRVSESNDYIYRGSTSCKKKKRKPRPKNQSALADSKVSQAVFDFNKKQLDTELTIERADDATETVNIALHFFVNDQFGVQHIATEFVKVSPNFDIGDKAVVRKTSSFKWLNNLESHENLYVISEAVNNYDADYHQSPTFDAFEATAVLISPQRTVARN